MSFHAFARLPRELRDNIWLLAVEPKSHTEIHVRRIQHKEPAESNYERRMALLESGEPQYGTKPWPAMQSCREARIASQRIFIPPTSVKTPPPPWLNWGKITLFCGQTHLSFLMESPLGAEIINLTLPHCCLFGMTYSDGYPPVPLIRHELPRLQNLLIIPSSTTCWEIYYGMTYFEMDWFDLMTRICLGSYADPGEVVKFRTRIGHPELPERNWLTSDNFLQRKYLDWTRDGLHDSYCSGQKLVVPVYYHDRWGLRGAGKTSDLVPP